MSASPLLDEPSRVEEPTRAHEYSEVFTQVAADGRSVIVCRNGADLAAVIPVELLELVRETLARQTAEELASQIQWNGRKDLRPPQSWFDDDEDNPFEPVAERSP